VETQEQLQFLSDHQCDGYQGFWFSKPLPLAEFEQYMDEGRDERREDREWDALVPRLEKYKL